MSGKRNDRETIPTKKRENKYEIEMGSRTGFGCLQAISLCHALNGLASLGVRGFCQQSKKVMEQSRKSEVAAFIQNKLQVRTPQLRKVKFQHPTCSSCLYKTGFGHFKEEVSKMECPQLLSEAPETYICRLNETVSSCDSEGS